MGRYSRQKSPRKRKNKQKRRNSFKKGFGSSSSNIVETPDVVKPDITNFIAPFFPKKFREPLKRESDYLNNLIDSFIYGSGPKDLTFKQRMYATAINSGLFNNQIDNYIDWLRYEINKRPVSLFYPDENQHSTLYKLFNKCPDLSELDTDGHVKTDYVTSLIPYAKNKSTKEYLNDIKNYLNEFIKTFIFPKYKLTFNQKFILWFLRTKNGIDYLNKYLEWVKYDIKQNPEKFVSLL